MLGIGAAPRAEEIGQLVPPMIANAGLKELDAGYAGPSGVTFKTTVTEIGKLTAAIKTTVPPPDVIFLPTDMMAKLQADGGIDPASRTGLGRMEIGLAVKAGAPHPDISSVAKLATVLKNARAVVYSNPATGSLEARIIDDLLNRPEFAGVHKQVSTKGNGISALARGEGDIALQLVCEILDRPETELVGPLPAELGAHIDADIAILKDAPHADQAAAYLRYITQPQAATVWQAKGLTQHALQR